MQIVNTNIHMFLSIKTHMHTNTSSIKTTIEIRNRNTIMLPIKYVHAIANNVPKGQPPA